MANVDFDVLRKDPTWHKKITTVAECNDLDKDGYISRADLELVPKRYKSLSLADPSHAAVVDKAMGAICTLLGLEGSKKITYADFAEAFVSGAGEQIMAEKLDIQIFGSEFDTVDADGDGSINLDEWRAHYECSTIPVEHAEASFDEIDKNHDGLISKDEFLVYRRLGSIRTHRLHKPHI